MSEKSLTLCECGCGITTNFASRNSKTRKWVKGEPLRFIKGHTFRSLKPRGSPIKDNFNGRWYVYDRNRKRIWWYRIVLENKLERSLKSNEHVHHINENPGDDRIENLILVTPEEHNRIHRHGA